MKKITLSQISPPDLSSALSARRQYLVNLNGRTYGFRRLDRAQDFLVEISRALSQGLVDLNDLAAVVFSSYRQVWPYLEDNPQAYQAQHDLEAALGQGLAALERTTQRHGENYQAFVFKDLFLACDSFIQAMDQIQKVARIRSDAAGKYRCNTIKSYILQVKKRIFDLACDHPALLDPSRVVFK